jgi:hypothetical protein
MKWHAYDNMASMLLTVQPVEQKLTACDHTLVQSVCAAMYLSSSVLDASYRIESAVCHAELCLRQDVNQASASLLVSREVHEKTLATACLNLAWSSMAWPRPRFRLRGQLSSGQHPLQTPRLLIIKPKKYIFSRCLLGLCLLSFCSVLMC